MPETFKYREIIERIGSRDATVRLMQTLNQHIAGREASYTSFDFGAYYERGGLHLVAELMIRF